jgi:hypothetical protein
LPLAGTSVPWLTPELVRRASVSPFAQLVALRPVGATAHMMAARVVGDPAAMVAGRDGGGWGGGADELTAGGGLLADTRLLDLPGSDHRAASQVGATARLSPPYRVH